MLNGPCLRLSHRCVPGTRNLHYLFTSRLLTLPLFNLVYKSAAAISHDNCFHFLFAIEECLPGSGEKDAFNAASGSGRLFWNKQMKSSAVSAVGKGPLCRFCPDGVAAVYTFFSEMF